MADQVRTCLAVPKGKNLSIKFKILKQSFDSRLGVVILVPEQPHNILLNPEDGEFEEKDNSWSFGLDDDVTVDKNIGGLLVFLTVRFKDLPNPNYVGAGDKFVLPYVSFYIDGDVGKEPESLDLEAEIVSAELIDC